MSKLTCVSGCPSKPARATLWVATLCAVTLSSCLETARISADFSKHPEKFQNSISPSDKMALAGNFLVTSQLFDIPLDNTDQAERDFKKTEEEQRKKDEENYWKNVKPKEIIEQMKRENSISGEAAPQFIQKGSAIGDTKSTFNYVEVPVYGQYNKMTKSGVVSVGVGPYAAFAVGGHIKTTTTTGTVKVSPFGSTGSFKRFDAGASLKVDYQLKGGLVIGAQYDHGLANITKALDATSKNRTISINAGYSLSKLFNKAK
jgi:Outer membrane protein beta-barrel domain